MANQLNETVVNLLKDLINVVREDVIETRKDLKNIRERITRIEQVVQGRAGRANGLPNVKRSRPLELARVGALPAAVVTLIEVGRYLLELIWS